MSANRREALEQARQIGGDEAFFLGVLVEDRDGRSVGLDGSRARLEQPVQLRCGDVVPGEDGRDRARRRGSR
ncbi:MAG: hypothetical protein WKF78_12805 [Candidatus Limnocylindrales bacterium]